MKMNFLFLVSLLLLLTTATFTLAAPITIENTGCNGNTIENQNDPNTRWNFRSFNGCTLTVRNSVIKYIWIYGNGLKVGGVTVIMENVTCIHDQTDNSDSMFDACLAFRESVSDSPATGVTKITLRNVTSVTNQFCDGAIRKYVLHFKSVATIQDGGFVIVEDSAVVLAGKLVTRSDSNDAIRLSLVSVVDGMSVRSFAIRNCRVDASNGLMLATHSKGIEVYAFEQRSGMLQGVSNGSPNFEIFNTSVVIGHKTIINATQGARFIFCDIQEFSSDFSIAVFNISNSSFVMVEPPGGDNMYRAATTNFNNLHAGSFDFGFLHVNSKLLNVHTVTLTDNKAWFLGFRAEKTGKGYPRGMLWIGDATDGVVELIMDNNEYILVQDPLHGGKFHNFGESRAAFLQASTKSFQSASVHDHALISIKNCVFNITAVSSNDAGSRLSLVDARELNNVARFEIVGAFVVINTTFPEVHLLRLERGIDNCSYFEVSDVTVDSITIAQPLTNPAVAVDIFLIHIQQEVTFERLETSQKFLVQNVDVQRISHDYMTGVINRDFNIAVVFIDGPIAGGGDKGGVEMSFANLTLSPRVATLSLRFAVVRFGGVVADVSKFVKFSQLTLNVDGSKTGGGGSTVFVAHVVLFDQDVDNIGDMARRATTPSAVTNARKTGLFFDEISIKLGNGYYGTAAINFTCVEFHGGVHNVSQILFDAVTMSKNPSYNGVGPLIAGAILFRMPVEGVSRTVSGRAGSGEGGIRIKNSFVDYGVDDGSQSRTYTRVMLAVVHFAGSSVDAAIVEVVSCRVQARVIATGRADMFVVLRTQPLRSTGGTTTLGELIVRDSSVKCTTEGMGGRFDDSLWLAVANLQGDPAFALSVAVTESDIMLRGMRLYVAHHKSPEEDNFLSIGILYMQSINAGEGGASVDSLAFAPTTTAASGGGKGGEGAPAFEPAFVHPAAVHRHVTVTDCRIYSFPANTPILWSNHKLQVIVALLHGTSESHAMLSPGRSGTASFAFNLLRNQIQAFATIASSFTNVSIFSAVTRNSQMLQKMTSADDGIFNGLDNISLVNVSDNRIGSSAATEIEGLNHTHVSICNLQAPLLNLGVVDVSRNRIIAVRSNTSDSRVSFFNAPWPLNVSAIHSSSSSSSSVTWRFNDNYAGKTLAASHVISDLSGLFFSGAGENNSSNSSDSLPNLANLTLDISDNEFYLIHGMSHAPAVTARFAVVAVDSHGPCGVENITFARNTFDRMLRDAAASYMITSYMASEPAVVRNIQFLHLVPAIYSSATAGRKHPNGAGRAENNVNGTFFVSTLALAGTLVELGDDTDHLNTPAHTTLLLIDNGTFLLADVVVRDSRVYAPTRPSLIQLDSIMSLAQLTNTDGRISEHVVNSNSPLRPRFNGSVLIENNELTKPGWTKPRGAVEMAAPGAAANWNEIGRQTLLPESAWFFNVGCNKWPSSFDKKFKEEFDGSLTAQVGVASSARVSLICPATGTVSRAMSRTGNSSSVSESHSLSMSNTSSNITINTTTTTTTTTNATTTTSATTTTTTTNTTPAIIVITDPSTTTTTQPPETPAPPSPSSTAATIPWQQSTTTSTPAPTPEPTPPPPATPVPLPFPITKSPPPPPTTTAATTPRPQQLEHTQSVTAVVRLAEEQPLVKQVPATMNLVGQIAGMTSGSITAAQLGVRQAIIAAGLTCGQPPGPLDRSTSPTQMEISDEDDPNNNSGGKDDPYRFLRGMIVGNAIIVGACLLICALGHLLQFVVERRNEKMKRSFSNSNNDDGSSSAPCLSSDRAVDLTRRFVNKLTIAAGTAWFILCGPAATAASALLYHGSHSSATNMLVACLGGFFVAILPLILLAVICYKAKSAIVLDTDVTDADMNGGDTAEEADKKRSGCGSMIAAVSSYLFGPFRKKSWPGLHPLVRRYGFSFERSSSLSFPVLEAVFSSFALNVLVGITQGVGVSLVFCRVAAIAVCALQVPPLLFIVFSGVILTRIDLAVSVLMYVLNILTSSFVIVQVFAEDSSVSRATSNEVALGVLTLLQGIVNLLTAVAFLSYFLRSTLWSDITKKAGAGDDGSGNNRDRQQNQAFLLDEDILAILDSVVNAEEQQQRREAGGGGDDDDDNNFLPPAANNINNLPLDDDAIALDLDLLEGNGAGWELDNDHLDLGELDGDDEVKLDLIDGELLAGVGAASNEELEKRRAELNKMLHEKHIDI